MAKSAGAWLDQTGRAWTGASRISRMTDETPNLPPDRKVHGDSPLAKVCRYLIETIRVVAANTDRELAVKILAVAIALGYLIAIVIAAVVREPSVAPIVSFVASFAVLLLVPLGLIWFPDEIGSITGYVSHGCYIDTATPPALVAFIGWLILLLIGIPVVAISLGYE
jgi:hypothetical protein